MRTGQRPPVTARARSQFNSVSTANYEEIIQIRLGMRIAPAVLRCAEKQRPVGLGVGSAIKKYHHRFPAINRVAQKSLWPRGDAGGFFGSSIELA